ncbi:hypothetical protein K431DRAFT_294916 [Polychaeton citri CBS 116435]|uniref:Uncharacterized protein n=1 Tax=Polychaeton citri CBS 116435 TaxID=1314669 RepID=A0A9P4QA18_9PEZI|nr:hypothetical protein K431DRAFT_294916 [Polychaeton citri CBS 116435]
MTPSIRRSSCRPELLCQAPGIARLKRGSSHVPAKDFHIKLRLKSINTSTHVALTPPYPYNRHLSLTLGDDLKHNTWSPSAVASVAHIDHPSHLVWRSYILIAATYLQQLQDRLKSYDLVTCFEDWSKAALHPLHSYKLSSGSTRNLIILATGNLALPKSNAAKKRVKHVAVTYEVQPPSTAEKLAAVIDVLAIEDKDFPQRTSIESLLMREPPCDSKTSSREARLREVAQHKMSIFRGANPQNRNWRDLPVLEDSEKTVTQLHPRAATHHREEPDYDLEDMIG